MADKEDQGKTNNKRFRACFTKKQKQILEAEFHNRSYLDKLARKELSNQMKPTTRLRRCASAPTKIVVKPTEKRTRREEEETEKLSKPSRKYPRR